MPQPPDRLVDVTVIDTPNLGDRSYVVAHGGSAVVVDPQRDVDRVLAVLTAGGLRVTHVLETHLHNDYVSGGLVLARQLGAEYVVPAGYALAYPATQVGDGDRFASGAMQWRALHTPGHTPQHLSYAVAIDDADQAVFTGGSMLYGSVGRPDLIGPEHTLGLAHDQWRSVRRLAEEVADDAAVFPTHGFGSFCSVTATVGLESTVGQQRLGNPALTLDEQEFVDELVAGLDAYPAYYVHMGPANAAGAGPVDLALPERADAAELRARIDTGEWVVDLRSRQLFAQGHLRGTLSFDALGNAVTYLGWLIPWGTPVTLLGETPEQVQDFQRELVRIGIDRPAAFASGSPSDWAVSPQEVNAFRQVDFGGLAQAMAGDPDLLVLDTRRRLEWHDSHVVGARHVPLHDLPTSLMEVLTWSRGAAHAGRDATVWVYCGSGLRAATACSLLERVGVPIVHVDDDWANAAVRGARVVSEERSDDMLRFGAAVTA